MLSPSVLKFDLIILYLNHAIAMAFFCVQRDLGVFIHKRGVRVDDYSAMQGVLDIECILVSSL